MEELVAEIVASILNIVVEVAFAFWVDIVTLVSASLLTWIQTDLGALVAASVRDAFFVLGTITLATYDSIKESWSELRRFLIEALIEFEQSSSRSWTRRFTTTLLRVLESGQLKLIKREIEEEVDWDHLPPEIRAAWWNSAQKSHKVDFIEVRDKEIQTLAH
ncbi:hypothetical protein B9G53_01170 [Pseudanabaena sp. SR411]|uniref:hypothetical protein n=1 Tax=Pseudanabaena sp. SR411 TaxID=1980935 RepID=UPI000B990B58|nr:hypothetical protein [Pseudanabaena sp. SR411]OYQ67493.1 hypothetical protein B9G53_01170 [Pseudanabaena sp. SR411]